MLMLLLMFVSVRWDMHVIKRGAGSRLRLSLDKGYGMIGDVDVIFYSSRGIRGRSVVVIVCMMAIINVIVIFVVMFCSRGGL